MRKSRKVIIGTRGSQLALWQARHIKQCLLKCYPDLVVELKVIKTTGDEIQNRSLVGLGKGVFTKEIEAALLAKEIDLAVHSMKDLPVTLPDGLCLAAIPEREDPRDVLVTKTGAKLDALPVSAKVGTTSPRRKSQLLHLRSDLQVVDVRGNLDTRLRKLRETALDGLILAAAGIKRLLDETVITHYFEPHEMTPAVGQGALGLETRQDDTETRELLIALNDRRSECEVVAERALLRTLGGGCQVPIGANAQHTGDALVLTAAVCSLDGRERIQERSRGEPDNAASLGESLAEQLLRKGADKLLA